MAKLYMILSLLNSIVNHYFTSANIIVFCNSYPSGIDQEPDSMATIGMNVCRFIANSSDLEGKKSILFGGSHRISVRIALLHLSSLSQQEIHGNSFGEFKLDFEELCRRQRNIASIDTPQLYHQIFCGGMPALINKQYDNRNIYYSSYINTYMERDIRDLSGTIDSLKFHKFITAVAARASQMVNCKGIADDCDIDQTTAKSWLNILETLGIIFYLHPYSNNILKRTVKTPKLYFYDTGLVCYLTKWSSPETTMNGAMNGALLENYVVGEIQKSYQNEGKEAFLYYYRDKDAKEIDLLIEGDGQLYPVEIKKTATPERKMIASFSVIDKSPLVRKTGAVLCMAEKLGAFDSQNLIIPIGLI